MTYETRCYIAGEFTSSKTTFVLHNAATGDPLVEVHSADKDDVDRAVKAAQAIQPKWSERPVQERAQCLFKLADLVEKHSKKMAEIDALSMGKPVSTAGFVAPMEAGRIRFDAALAQSVLGESSMLSPGQLGIVLRQPYGVVSAILPWNVPILMLVNKLAAVAAGNSLIVKTSEKSPLSGAYFASLIREAGFPDGVIQIIHGDGKTGRLLAEHPHIRKISFTGSARTGRLVAQAAAASNLKNVSLELGGKSPAIIFPDADLKEAAQACSLSISFNSGQACAANSRIYVHESVAPEFIDTFKQIFTKYKHGDPLAADTTLGPQADSIQGETVQKYIAIGKEDGGKVETGGRRVGDKGWFFEPTLFTNVPDDSKFNKEEIFGPVLNISTFKTEEEVLRRANASEYGLYASVFTTNLDRAIRVSKALEAGTVAVNCSAPSMLPEQPFGGWKQSGLGRESGVDSVLRWTEEKSVVIRYQPHSEGVSC